MIPFIIRPPQGTGTAPVPSHTAASHNTDKAAFLPVSFQRRKASVLPQDEPPEQLSGRACCPH